MRRIDGRSHFALYGIDETRRIELAAQLALPEHTLMRRAGLAVAQLALAIAPHSRRIWIGCGPGNNGGDGLEAATHLQRWGKHPVVTWLGTPDKAPRDASASWRRAVEAGVPFSETPPEDFDLCIDALLGIGATRAPEGLMAEWIKQINTSAATIVSVDAPTGLHANTGLAAPHCVKANHTLSLLTLKPGLFTGHGRDAAGTVWIDDLQVAHASSAWQEAVAPTAWLAGAPTAAPARLHASHKGSYGDVAIVGGAPGMTGAALLAACAALHAGAGRVFVGLLDAGSLRVDTQQPELMFRPIDALDFKGMTVVCGCGGGDAIRGPLPRALSTSAQMVVDADAINVIADDTALQTLLRARARQFASTVLTPHPLEAARLLGATTIGVQSDRMAAALEIAGRFDCTVVLKGSGTIIAAPGQTSVINSTGNARLATAGTGDVLAGAIAAGLANGLPAFQAACETVYRHGLCADQWPHRLALSAGALARAMQQMSSQAQAVSEQTIRFFE